MSALDDELAKVLPTITFNDLVKDEDRVKLKKFVESGFKEPQILGLGTTVNYKIKTDTSGH